MELSIDQIKYLKALLDIAILQNCKDFEYPCFFSFHEISQEEEKDLEEKDLIGWHDGWNITYKGEKEYHEHKRRLAYYQKDRKDKE